MMLRKRFETTVDPQQFQRIQQRLPAPQKLRILISTREGVPQAGLVATAVGETGIYLLGATSNDGMKSKGAYLLQWQMMNRLRECGCQGYDLGGINPQTNPGVYHFKAGLGGDEVSGLGRFVWRRARLSAWAVAAGERLQMVAGKIRR
jgi:lipid II:glycine glycyltransferase (peptidoglycan interpeptide bridge formation enzyme)